ncbi:hypothetical protein ENBRE01_2463 [Enteropsectra breve]|nr:hypothetical protein ENBRE01_2463 [Enteropsectra breve]
MSTPINIKDVIINNALLDTGADVSCISTTFAKRLGLKMSNG